jgi:siderophore synthetase component
MPMSTVWDRLNVAIASPHYAAAEQRVTRQLLETLLFENVLTYRIDAAEDGRTLFRFSGLAANGDEVRYECRGRVSESFGRIRLDIPTLRRRADGSDRPPSGLQELLLEIAAALPGVDETRLSGFLDELRQTLLKDVQALQQRDPEPRERDLTGLEGHLQDGHPYHPCYKSRVGFDPVDNEAFGPEFHPDLRLLWLAVHRDLATLDTGRGVDFETLLRIELGDASYETFRTLLRDLSLDPAEYLFCPVHPWQWREKIVPALFPLLRSRAIVRLGEGNDLYRPLQSIRSLANHSRPRLSQIKLPIGIINTSADRVLSCHHVRNGPAVSDWLCELRDGDPFLRERGLIVLKEFAGVTYQDASLPIPLQSRQYGILGAAWRESLETFLHAGESAAPFSGLCQCEADGSPFIDPWIRRHGLSSWLDALFEASVPPLIHLLYAHGIGLEAHGQNLVLIHQEGLPCRIAVKDLPGGLRYVRDYLSVPQRCPGLVPAPSFRRKANAPEGMEAPHPEDVRDYFHDGVFFINFGELSLFLHDRYELPEREFWSRLAGCLRRYQAHRPELADRFRAFDLFAPDIVVEQLTKRRLFSDADAHLHRVPNPLHPYRREDLHR